VVPVGTFVGPGPCGVRPCRYLPAALAVAAAALVLQVTDWYLIGWDYT
jgi:hypothetical protein